MRIAIYENLPPGGAKRAAYELGRSLAERHDIDLYQLSITNNRAFDLRPAARRVYTYAFQPLRGSLDRRLAGGHYAPRSYTLFAPLRRLHRRIAADIQQRGYDVVLAHTDSMTQSPYLLRWLPGTPTVYFCQEVFRVAQERAVRVAHRRLIAASPFPVGVARLIDDSLVQRRLEGADRGNAAAAGTIVVNSKYSRDRVWAVYQRDASVCYLGVDTEVFSPSGDPLPRPPHKGEGDDLHMREGDPPLEVLSVGGPPHLKGHDTVIEALALIPTRSRPALRVVLPADREVETLRRVAEARAVALTIEIGITDAQLADRYRRARATICAARLEPFGFTPLESMACGTPVIAIDEGGYRETVRAADTGVLVDADPAAIARAIESLSATPEEARSMGARGRAWVEAAWTWPQSGRRLEGILQAAAGH